MLQFKLPCDLPCNDFAAIRHAYEMQVANGIGTCTTIAQCKPELLQARMHKQDHFA